MSEKPYLLIDNYDSFTFNLLQYLSEIAAEFNVWRNDQFTIKELKELAPKVVLISPGPGRPESSGLTPEVVSYCVENKVPLLGICLGHQAIGLHFGARLELASKVFHGKTSEIGHDGCGVFEGLPEKIEVGRYHSLTLDRESLPEELIVTASTLDEGEVMGLRHRDLPIESMQFHPESILTAGGKDMLKNFFKQIAP